MTNHYDSAPAHPSNRGSMQGFDDEFVDIVDYILRITYRIWEGKQIGLCRDYYSEDCPVYTLAGMTVGAEEVTQNTLNTLAAFPDRTLHADNIIWGGNDQDGFHSSHLISTEMTNMGDSEFGAASGKHAKIQVIAHCVCKDNQVIEEWLVRDNYSLAEQLGFDPEVLAQKFAAAPMQERYREWYKQELERVPQITSSQRIAPKGAKGDADNQAIVRAALQNIWNARMVGDVYQAYAEDAALHASANHERSGQQQIAEFYTDFLGTLSELRFSADYSCEIPNDQGGTDVAVRWTMTGNHTGSKLFGKPCGAPILVIGESQYRVVDGKILEEWTVFDQLAILTQIYRARGV